MAADLSFLTYFAPILAFLLVFVVSFAVLSKTKLIGENSFLQSFISLIIAAIFVASAGVRDLVLNIVPWVAFLIVSLVFVMILLKFSEGNVEFIQKGIGIIFIIAVFIVFIISGYVVFSDTLAPYLPGTTATGGDTFALEFFDWLFSARVIGAISIIVVGGLVAWILTKE